MPHFMMDCYYPDATKFDALRRDSFPIKASDVDSAIEEAKRAAIWKKPAKFALREVSKRADRVVYRSE